MEFSVLFWNLWLDNQVHGPHNSARLLGELQRIIGTYQPDCIGLNEALQHKDDDQPFVLEHLQKLGYTHSYFAAASPLDDDWQIGAAVCSRLPLRRYEEIQLGPDTPAQRRGYPGYTVKAIAARLDVGHNHTVGFVVAHPIHLRPHTMSDHYQHTRRLSQFLKMEPYNTGTIIGGDFNEPAFMPRSFLSANKTTLHHRTGTFKNPTWRNNASRVTPIRANLDHIFWTKAGGLKLIDFAVIDSPVSDHKPLFAKFRVADAV